MSDVAKPGVWSLIREDLRTQREGILAQGFWALFVHRLAHPRLHARRGPLRKLWAIVNRLAIKWTEMVAGISIGEAATIGRRLSIEHFGQIIVHGGAVIGDDCLIRHGVTIGNSAVDDPGGAPVIGNGVVVGAGAMILGRITIGDGAVIGANAVVVRDVPAGGVAVGIPAKLVKIRTPAPEPNGDCD